MSKLWDKDSKLDEKDLENVAGGAGVYLENAGNVETLREKYIMLFKDYPCSNPNCGRFFGEILRHADEGDIMKFANTGRLTCTCGTVSDQLL